VLSLLLFPDDVWSQRAVVKRQQPGGGGRHVPSALLLPRRQTGSECRGVGAEGRRHQTDGVCPRGGVGVLLLPHERHVVGEFRARRTTWCRGLCFRVAADALRILLARAELDEVMKRLDEDKAWDAMKEAASHATGVTLLARCVYYTRLDRSVNQTVTAHTTGQKFDSLVFSMKTHT